MVITAARDAVRKTCWCPKCGREFEDAPPILRLMYLKDGRPVYQCLGCQIGILHRVLLSKELGDG